MAGGKDLLRFLTAGSVDDGKSTLIGRLLFELGHVMDDQMAALQRDSARFGTVGEEIDLALLVDGLEAERQQGITIDVAYRYFATPRRSFIVADAPGHEQYTRNMATAASVSELAVLLVDVTRGVLPQTLRHSSIARLVGVRHIVLAVNKMDAVGFDRAAFERIAADYARLSGPLGFASVEAIPLSARSGENVTRRGEHTPWYDGPTLIEQLEAADVERSEREQPFRFPVQWVNRPDAAFRGYSGTVTSGRVRAGDPVILAHTGRETRVERIVTHDGDLPEAAAGDAVTLTLAEELDLARGDVLAEPRARPEVTDQFTANIVWLDEEPLLPGRAYVMKIGRRYVPATVTTLKHRVDVETHERMAARTLALNDIGECNLSTGAPVAIDPYEENRGSGAFILVDRFTNRTAGAGMVLHGLRRATNIHRQQVTIDRAERERLNRHRSAVLWFTGLPGSGKSTVANLVELKLHARGVRTFLLDGDNVRHGLNRDLGFTAVDRVENIRRVGEVSKLFLDAGLVVLSAFISPFKAERRMVSELFADGEFFEVFVDTPLEECIRRDPKGLYAKALRGEIGNFTGVDSPYEAPEHPALSLDTLAMDADAAAERVIALLAERGVI